MHDESLNGKTEGGLDKNLLVDAAFLAEKLGITEARAVSVIGQVMKITNRVVTGKEAREFVMEVYKKPIKLLTAAEGELLLYAGLVKLPGKPWVSKVGDIGRNEPCPCGSGKKFKQCCLDMARLSDRMEYLHGKR